MKNRSTQIVIDNKTITANYHYSRRKSLMIKIVAADIIEINAPHLLPNYKIDQFVHLKKNWILKKLSNVRPKETGVLLFLGEKYTVIRCKTSKITRLYGAIEIPEHFHLHDISEWYREQSKEIVEDLYRNLSFEKKPAKISIRKQERRWGSCTSKGNIYINSRISMCPVEVIEYILYHELCHLVYLNHSLEFYQLLESYCKDYRQKKKWLKENSHYLDISGIL